MAFNPMGGMIPPEMMIDPLGRRSQPMQCPYCKTEIKTDAKKVTPGAAIGMGVMLAIVGCICGCCLVPCVADGFKNTDHTCPNCKRLIGSFNTAYPDLTQFVKH